MTSRSLVTLSVGLLLSWAGVQGAMADVVADPACPTTGTYQDLINTNGTGGCTISTGVGGSLIFSDFVFTGSGPGTPNAAGVTYTLDNPATGPLGEQVWGFEFNPGLSVIGSPVGSVTQDIMLSYLVVPVGVSIVSNDLKATATATGSGVGMVTEDLMFCIATDPNNTSGTCRVFSAANPPHVTTGPPPALEDNRTFGAWTSMMVSKDINATSGSLVGTAAITDVRDAVDVVPEPGTYGLVSIALVTIGYFSRRRSAR